MVPTALTMGEELGCTGKQVITAVAIGYEVTYRIASHVIAVVGINKITADVDSAIKRIRTDACTANALRHNLGTPWDWQRSISAGFSEDGWTGRFSEKRMQPETA